MEKLNCNSLNQDGAHQQERADSSSPDRLDHLVPVYTHTQSMTHVETELCSGFESPEGSQPDLLQGRSVSVISGFKNLSIDSLLPKIKAVAPELRDEHIVRELQSPLLEKPLMPSDFLPPILSLTSIRRDDGSIHLLIPPTKWGTFKQFGETIRISIDGEVTKGGYYNCTNQAQVSFKEDAHLRTFHHENIIPPAKDFTWYMGPRQNLSLLLFVDVAKHGDGAQFAQTEGRTLADVLKVVAGVASGLDYLHQKEMVHRDVKPANMLVYDDGTGKVSDLGTVCKTGEANALAGTSRYIAPSDYRRDKQVTPATDVYALGVSLAEMITWAGVEEQPEAEPILDFATLMTHVNPKKRPTAQEVATRLSDEATALTSPAKENSPVSSVRKRRRSTNSHPLVQASPLRQAQAPVQQKPFSPVNKRPRSSMEPDRARFL